MGTKLGKQKWPSSFRSDVKLGQPTRLNDLSTITAWARLHTTAYLRLFRLTSGLVCPTFKCDYTHRVTLWKPFKIWQVGCRLDQHREGHLWSAPLRQELNWEGKGRSYTINAAHFYMAQIYPKMGKCCHSAIQRQWLIHNQQLWETCRVQTCMK